MSALPVTVRPGEYLYGLPIGLTLPAGLDLRPFADDVVDKPAKVDYLVSSDESDVELPEYQAPRVPLSSNESDVELPEHQYEQEQYSETSDPVTIPDLPVIQFEDMEPFVRTYTVHIRTDLVSYEAAMAMVYQRHITDFYRNLHSRQNHRRSNLATPDSLAAAQTTGRPADPILTSPNQPDHIARAHGFARFAGGKKPFPNRSDPADAIARVLRLAPYGKDSGKTTPTKSGMVPLGSVVPVRPRTVRKEDALALIDAPTPSKLEFDDVPGNVSPVVLQMLEHADMPRSLFEFHAQQKRTITKFFGAEICDALTGDFLEAVQLPFGNEFLHRSWSYSRWAHPIAVWLSSALARCDIKVDINIIYKGILLYPSAHAFCHQAIVHLKIEGHMPEESRIPDDFATARLEYEIRRICDHYEQLISASHTSERQEPRIHLAPGGTSSKQRTQSSQSTAAKKKKGKQVARNAVMHIDAQNKKSALAARSKKQRTKAARDVEMPIDTHDPESPSAGRGKNDGSQVARDVELQADSQDEESPSVVRSRYRSRPKLVKTPQTVTGRRRRDARSLSPTDTIRKLVGQQMQLKS